MINLNLKIIFISVLFFSQNLFSQEISSEVKKILIDHFGEDVQITFSKYNLEKNLKESIEKKVNQKFYSNSVYLYFVRENQVIKGYGILDNVYGKSLPITFLVMFDTTGTIISSHIVKYREPYGGAVKNENWNRQFSGKNCQSTFDVGKDINSISGATISVNSVTKGIQKLTFLMKEILSGK